MQLVSNSRQYEEYGKKEREKIASESHVAWQKNQLLFIDTNTIKHVDILPVKSRGVTFYIFDRFSLLYTAVFKGH
jgi:hypothetical protein